MKKKLSKQQQADIWYDSIKGTPIIWGKKEKDFFRETSYWKKFVKRIKKNKCDFCTCNTTHSTLHHIYPKNYDELVPENFASLCWSCHTKISQLSRRNDKGSIPEYFLPFIEKDKDD
jgi:hypothetical protein